MRRQATHWGNAFAKDKFYNGPLSKIHKELLKLNNIKMKKMGK
jgi:hypothetical protein